MSIALQQLNLIKRFLDTLRQGDLSARSEAIDKIAGDIWQQRQHLVVLYNGRFYRLEVFNSDFSIRSHIDIYKDLAAIERDGLRRGKSASPGHILTVKINN